MKKRLDVLLFEKGFAESRERAKALIMSGIVYVDNQKCDKAGAAFSEDVTIDVRGKTLKYVSRGGLKLEKAINDFSLDLKDKICMDIGASTGGFTDCMLQNAAKLVYCVDVGYGQLAWKLRNDERVINLERTNARNLTKAEIPDEIAFTSIDVSFISLTIVLEGIRDLLADKADLICLIKPQFEAGREKVGKKGVVRDIAVHNEVIERIVSFSIENGYSLINLTFSPIKGPEGNIEYLIYLKKDNSAEISGGFPIISEVTAESHRILNGA